MSNPSEIIDVISVNNGEIVKTSVELETNNNYHYYYEAHRGLIVASAIILQYLNFPEAAALLVPGLYFFELLVFSLLGQLCIHTEI